jgi:predicted RNA-binding Zn ribbon-like protein
MLMKMRAPFAFQLKGGDLCLDFANTVSYRRDPHKRLDHLSAFADFMQWTVQTGIVGEATAAKLLSNVGRSPKKSGQAFRRVIRLREAIYGIFSSVAHGADPRSTDLAILEAEFKNAMLKRRVAGSSGRGFKWEWSLAADDLQSPLWAIAESAGDLLVSDRLRSVRECVASDCGWLFLDHSSNQRRRWCDMKDCGNRAKARTHYHRIRTQSASQ